MAQFDAGKDYYETLGAERDATQAEIERLYKRQAAYHHPDHGGDEERMKALNEAYRVLRDREARDAYDAERHPPAQEFVPHSSPSARADILSGRLTGAFLCLSSGALLLLLVRFHYVIYLWPLALLAGGLLLFGVWMAHAALGYARASYAPTHPARRYLWAQETAFWLAVSGCALGLYLLLRAV